MFYEFFCSRSCAASSCVSWAGLAVFVGHAIFKAWIKYTLNQWYGRFYDTVQWDGFASPNGSSFNSSFLEDDDDYRIVLAEKRTEVWTLLTEFVGIVAPIVVVSPVARYLANRWRFAWRMALVRAYLLHYDTCRNPIEGAAQRIHEDTRRFEEGMYRCVSMALDAVLSLAVFVPVLIALGSEVQLPQWRWAPWLLCIAIVCSFGGLAVSMLVGHKLVQLEVNNQRVEGRFRTGLVVLEQTPEELAKPSARGVAEPATRIATETPLLWFTSTIDALTHNYRRLYANFALFDTWISGYDQIMILLPYFLVAPMLFAERDSDRVTLGVLIRVTNAFKEVFGAMSILTENWDMVNDFRSTVRRLSEFEAHVYQQLHTFKRHRLVDDEHAAASGVQIAVAVAPPAAASTACVSAHTLASAPPL